MDAILFVKKLAKSTFHFFGLEAKKYNVYNSEDLLLQAMMRHFNIKTVIDVGANTGQYAKGLIDQGFKGRIWSFEPISSVFSQLKKNSTGFPEWTVINSGIGSIEQKLNINISKNFASSSFFNVKQSSVDAEPMSETHGNEEVQVTTLDKFFSINHLPSQPILLKLDVQGYEKEALQGAVSILPKVTLVQAELSFVPLYDGAPLYHEIMALLKERGFEIFTIIPGFRNTETGQMLQADGIFYRQ